MTTSDVDGQPIARFSVTTTFAIVLLPAVASVLKTVLVTSAFPPRLALRHNRNITLVI